MPTPSWATPSQWAFLETRLPQFSEAQKTKTLPNFWLTIYRDFFAQWPDQESELNEPEPQGPVAADGKKKKKKKKKSNKEEVPPLPQAEWTQKRKDNIYYWFNNHMLDKGRRGSGRVRKVQVAIQPSGSRLPSEQQIYSKKYYDERVKSLVEQEIGKQEVDHDQHIAIRNRITAEVYEKESEEVKEEIRRERAARQKAKDASQDAMKMVVNASDSMTPKEYLLAQAALPGMLQDFADAMRERTNWDFSLVAGGPDPARGGEIRTIAVHTGVNAHGLSFPKAYSDFKTAVLVPFYTFLNSAHSQEERDAMKLDTVSNIETTNTLEAGDISQTNAPDPVVPTTNVSTTNASLPDTSPTAAPKTDDASPTEAPKTDAASPTEAPKTDAASTAEAPKTNNANDASKTDGASKTNDETDDASKTHNVPATSKVVDTPKTETHNAQDTQKADSLQPDASMTDTVQTNAPKIDSPPNNLHNTSSANYPQPHHSPQATSLPQALDTTGMNQGGYTGQSEYAGMNQGGYVGMNQGGDTGIGQGGYTGMNQGGYTGMNLGSYAGMNQGGYTGMNQGGYTSANQSGYAGMNQSGYAGMNHGEYAGMNQGGYAGVGGFSTFVNNHTVTQMSSNVNTQFVPQQLFNQHATPAQYPPDVLRQSSAANHGRGEYDDYGCVGELNMNFDFDESGFAFDASLLSAGNLYGSGDIGQDYNGDNSLFTDTDLCQGITNQLVLPPQPASSPASASVNVPSPAAELTPLNHPPAPAPPANATDKVEPAEKGKRGGHKIATPPVNDENVNAGCGSRTRKPVGMKEVVPLTEKDTTPSVPEWLPTTMEYLREGIDDAEWQQCVERWFKFEESALLELTAHRFPVKTHPPALSKWLVSRKYPPPVVNDKTALAKEWCKWWNSIQPEWQQNSQADAIPLPISSAKQGDSIEGLRKGGPSGIITVMIGLKWWGPDDQHWKGAVRDMSECLESMMSMSGGGNKRKAIVGEGGSRGKSKKLKTA